MLEGLQSPNGVDASQEASENGEGLIVFQIRGSARNAGVERKAQPLFADAQRFPGAVREGYHGGNVPLRELRRKSVFF